MDRDCPARNSDIRDLDRYKIKKEKSRKIKKEEDQEGGRSKRRKSKKEEDQKGGRSRRNLYKS